jgi:hypothetical protein
MTDSELISKDTEDSKDIEDSKDDSKDIEVSNKHKVLHCLRCGSVWVRRFDRLPGNCAVCHSNRWNQPYRYKHTVKARQRT